MEKISESCGLFAIRSLDGKDVSFSIFSGLMALQHRGQDAAGICTFDGKRFCLKKELGLVSEVFPGDECLKLKGAAGIGHVRYPTIGVKVVKEEAHPIIWREKGISVALAQNGNIANYGALRKKAEKEENIRLKTNSDTELMAAIFCRRLAQTGDLFEAAEKCMEVLDGSYATVVLTSFGDLVVFRDRHAIKPLVFGQDGKSIAFASESVALDINSIKTNGDLKPGEIFVSRHNGSTERRISRFAAAQSAHCMFEYVYFARPDSTIDGRLVYDVRMQLGKNLALQKQTKADIIVPVPDTARAAAEGYSAQSGIPVVEGLIKNRYIGRTFIMPSQAKRQASVRLKLNAVSGLVKGKSVILIDDSIVRGTTMGPIVRLLREAGASQVHVRITCPPIISPCFYGIDIPTYKELAAHRLPVEEICKQMGADTLEYLSIENLVKSIGLGNNALCLGCITNNYITEAGKRLSIKLQSDESSDVASRIWEQEAQ